MNAKEARELSSSYMDKNAYRAGFILNKIYFLVRETCLIKGNCTEYLYTYNKNADSESRKALLKAVTEELIERGYKVTGKANKAISIRLTVSWVNA